MSLDHLLQWRKGKTTATTTKKKTTKKKNNNTEPTKTKYYFPEILTYLAVLVIYIVTHKHTSYNIII